MSRRDKAGGKAIRVRRRKTSTHHSAAVGNLRDQLDRRTRELNESREQQAVTLEVLKVISSSPGDLARVFDAILERAARLCEATHGLVWRFDGEWLHVAAVRGDPQFVEWLHQHNTVRPAPGSAADRIVRGARFDHMADRREESAYRDNQTFRGLVDTGGIRASLCVAVRNDETLLGMINVYRQEIRPFTDKQIALVENFASQAVIAIENTRLLNELRESLQQQTATADVLKIISSSPGQLTPVFNSMLENAIRICGAGFGTMFLFDGNRFDFAADYGTPPALVELQTRRGPTLPPPGGILDRVMRDKQVAHSADYLAEQPQSPPVALGGARSTVGVPMLKDSELVGAIVIYRKEVRPFSEKEIDLVKNFAAQAVIAIENTRLLNELRQRTGDLSEALDQQTATSEVLKVISSSPGELEPVFNAMLENATRICEAKFGTLYRYDGGAFHPVTFHKVPSSLADFLRQRGSFVPPAGTPLERLLRTRNVTHVVDDDSAKPVAGAAALLGGARVRLAVPMLKDNELVGAILIYRQEMRPFTDKQIELVTTFADQAVIAIENTRLLNELRESLQQQTATANVLKTISRSTFDLQAVLQTLVESAARLCDADKTIITREKNGIFYRAEAFGFPREFMDHVRDTPIKPERGSGVGRALLEGRLIHIPDVKADPEYTFIEHQKLGDFRTLLAVPMLREGVPSGVVTLTRTEARPFTDKQIELATTFADQAAIAIENVRLLNDLNKLNQQLEQRVADQVSEIERMGRLRRFLPPQVADLIVASGAEKQLESHRREITALFCDLRGFTGFSESSDPEDVMALLREYHAAIGGIINSYGGTLERYAGDGVMVVFNDPIPVDNPALQAVLMAIKMRAAIGELIEKWRKLGHDIGFGIGIAHGFATLGTIGFEGRFDYAAIGTVSNVASRLCDEAKPGQILISPRVLMAIEKDITVEPVGDFVLKGIRRPLTAYNVLATKAAD